MTDVFTAKLAANKKTIELCAELHGMELATYEIVDVTRKTGVAVFAPTWELLSPFLAMRGKLKRAATTPENPNPLITLPEEVWQDYVQRYTAEMRASYRRARSTWDALLRRDRVVLTCFCSNHEQCHRTVLARDILPRLGAVYRGELFTNGRE